MTRRYAWAVAVAAAVLLGFIFGSLRQSKADPPATASDSQTAQTAVLVEQVKEMQSQVREINTFLRTGSIKVVVLLNPEAPK